MLRFILAEENEFYGGFDAGFHTNEDKELVFVLIIDDIDLPPRRLKLFVAGNLNGVKPDRNML